MIQVCHSHFSSVIRPPQARQWIPGRHELVSHATVIMTAPQLARLVLLSLLFLAAMGCAGVQATPSTSLPRGTVVPRATTTLGSAIGWIAPETPSSLKGSAAPTKHVVFGGIGQAERGDPAQSDAQPWSVGYLYRGAGNAMYWGADIAGEGTLVNNTSGSDGLIEQGLAFDLLVGKTLNFSANWRGGIGILAGIRRTGLSCPESYLGYQCYADESPHQDFGFNYGAMAHLTFKQLLVGARASGESVQAIAGIAF
jgi:hypothetical protein